MPQRLDGKVALITGASRGLGRSIAGMFATEGAKVVFVDLKQHWVQAVIDELGLGGEEQALALGTDVSDREAVRAMVAATVSAFGRIDVLVNNAMWNRYEPLELIEPPTVERMLGVGFNAIIWALQAAAPAMKDGGSVVNIGSVSGRLGIANALVYCGVKAGVDGLTRAASVELGPQGIRVNAIAPSTVATEGVKAMLDNEAMEDRAARVPLGRLGQPDDIARAALWLASDDSRFVTGQTLAVDGGMAHAFM